MCRIGEFILCILSTSFQTSDLSNIEVLLNYCVRFYERKFITCEELKNDILGFQYPQHFLRFFKKEVGCTPKEYLSEASLYSAFKRRILY